MEVIVTRMQCLTRSMLASLGIVAVVALNGCAHHTNPQARAMPANLVTGAADAASPASGAPAAVQTPPAPQGTPPPQTPAPAQFAQVVAVQPLTQTETSTTPRRVCRNEEVAVPETYRDNHQIGGAVVGGLVGGLLGNQIGGGRGRTLATLAGAAGGAFAGHTIQRDHQQDNPSSMQMRYVCHTVRDQTRSTQTEGYEVTYILNGRAGHIRMNHNPGVGVGLPVRNGVVVNGAMVASEPPSGSYYR